MRDKIKAFFIQSVRLICFLAGLFVVLFLLQDIMIFKQEDGTNPIRNYYDLPQELIAQDPLEDRSASRLMVLSRETGEISHHHFYEIGEF